MHADKLVEKAKDALERRSYDMAIQLFLQATSLDPDNYEARRGLREAELGKYSAYYPSSLSRAIGGFAPSLAAGIAKLTKNHEKRMIALEKILSGDPKNVKIGMELAEASTAAGHLHAAVAAYEGVLLVDGKNLVALKGLGHALAKTNQPEKAIEQFEAALKIDPRDQESDRMRKNLAAEVSISSAGYDTAKHSRELIRDQEQQKELESRSKIVRGEDELAASAEALEKAVAEDPKNARALMDLGSRYAAMKDYDRAIDAYERAFAAEPTHFAARERAGDLKIARFERDIKQALSAGDEKRAAALKKQRLEAQVEEYRARVKEHPTDLGLRFLLGKTLYEHGDVDEAIGEFQQTVKDPRRKIEALTMLGNCFIAKGMFDLAENQLRKALDEAPGMSERTKSIIYSLGRLKEKQEQIDAALDEYKKIYEVDIHFRDVADRISKLKASNSEKPPAD